MATFDGDYATATVAIGDCDPLERCVQAFRENFVRGPWLVRRMPQLIHAGGFEIISMQSHGYVEAPEDACMLTWVGRGAGTFSCAPAGSARRRQRPSKRKRNGEA